MLDGMHDQVCHGLEQEKKDQRCDAAPHKKTAKKNDQMHGHDPGIRKHHDRPDVGIAAFVCLQVLQVWEAVVYDKNNDTGGHSKIKDFPEPFRVRI